MKILNALKTANTIVMSGIQPTGTLTLGNYLGALSQFRAIEENLGCRGSMFMIADLHSLTVPHDIPQPDKLRSNVYHLAASFIASGVKLENSFLFRQSAVPEHTQLMWLLCCLTSVGRLNMMTQYKSKKTDSRATAGLFCYPVLMAADILLYKPDAIPVGFDQMQHLELTSTLATAFNGLVHRPIFKTPEMLVLKDKAQAHVRNLKNPKLKMSKSDPDKNTKILLTDTPDAISKKIRKAVTDSKGIITSNVYSDTERLGVLNMLDMLAILKYGKYADARQEALSEVYGKTVLDLKNSVTEALISVICPIGDEIRRLLDDSVYIEQKLQLGKDKARERASQTYSECASALGLQ